MLQPKGLGNYSPSLLNHLLTRVWRGITDISVPSLPLTMCLGRWFPHRLKNDVDVFEKPEDLRLGGSKALSPSGELSGSIYSKKNPFN